MKFISKPLLIIYNLYAMLLFLVLMLLLFPFIILASFWGNVRGGNLIYRICTLWADIWFPLIGIVHWNIYEYPHNKKDSYIFTTNHITYLDAALIVKVFRQPVRPLGKYEIGKIPLFGYIYKKVIVAVDRSSADARAKSVTQLKRVLRQGISVLLFPEGTFNLTTSPLQSFYDGAFRIAIETQTDIKPVLFIDMFNRMPYGKLLSITPGKSRAVFMEPVSVQGLTMDDLPALKAKVHAVMSERLRDYNAGWIKG